MIFAMSHLGFLLDRRFRNDVKGLQPDRARHYVEAGSLPMCFALTPTTLFRTAHSLSTAFTVYSGKCVGEVSFKTGPETGDVMRLRLEDALRNNLSTSL